MEKAHSENRTSASVRRRTPIIVENSWGHPRANTQASDGPFSQVFDFAIVHCSQNASAIAGARHKNARDGARARKETGSTAAHQTDTQTKST